MAARTKTLIRRPKAARQCPTVALLVVWLCSLTIAVAPAFGQEVPKKPSRLRLWNGFNRLAQPPPKSQIPRSGKTETAKQTALWMRGEAIKHARRGDFSRAMRLAKRANALSVYVDWQPGERTPAAFMRDLKSIQRRRTRAPGVTSAAHPSEPARFPLANRHSLTTSRGAIRQSQYIDARNEHPLALDAEIEVIVLGNSRLDWNDKTNQEPRRPESAFSVPSGTHSAATPSQYAFNTEPHAPISLPVDAEWSNIEATESEAPAKPQTEVAFVSESETAALDPFDHTSFDSRLDGASTTEHLTTTTKPAAELDATSPAESLRAEDDRPVTESFEGNVEGGNEFIATTAMTDTTSVTPSPISTQSFSGLTQLAAVFCAVLLSILILAAIAFLMLRQYGLPAVRIELVGEHGQRVVTIGNPEQRLQPISAQSHITAFASQMQHEEDSSKRREAAMLKNVFEQNVRLRKQISQGV